MGELSLLQSIVVGGLALLAVYIVARLATAAYFNSKRDYEQRKTNHG